jgi:hypothetical protein
MDELNWFQRFILWLSTPKYNCSRNKHRWGYTLSESGIVYLDDKKVPKQMWKCLDCGIKKFRDK